MPLNFDTLNPRIERLINLLSLEYSLAPGSILTEDDLKCILFDRLRRLPALRKPRFTRDSYLPGTSVHSEISWFDENRRLGIRPDITIIEPEYLRILQDRAEPAVDPFCGPFGPVRRARRLPSKQYEYDGQAITLELKFARAGIDKTMLRLIKQDHRKILRLFGILDRLGEGWSVYSYLVIFDRNPRGKRNAALAEFLAEYGEGPRHKILYKNYSPRPSRRSMSSKWALEYSCRLIA
jgi:hypothetical protein